MLFTLSCPSDSGLGGPLVLLRRKIDGKCGEFILWQKRLNQLTDVDIEKLGDEGKICQTSLSFIVVYSFCNEVLTND